MALRRISRISSKDLMCSSSVADTSSMYDRAAQYFFTVLVVALMAAIGVSMLMDQVQELVHDVGTEIQVGTAPDH